MNEMMDSPLDNEQQPEGGMVEASEMSGRPDGVPDKFWDMESGNVRVDALVKSYNELERKFGSLPSVPESASAYEIKAPSDFLTPSTVVNERLHQAGFTQEQAQLVYDMAGDVLMPMITEVAESMEQEQTMTRLQEAFGGKNRWNEVSNQIRTWGRENLSQDVYDALSGSYDGIMTLHRMMGGKEPSLKGPSSPVSGSQDETTLQEMMRDPKYWRDRDPALVQQVREGFRRLYPD